MKHRFRIVLVGFVFLLLGSLSLSLVRPKPAAADQTGTVVDRSTIKVGDRSFVDSDIDDNFNYSESDPADGCGDTIKGFSNHPDMEPGHTPSSATIVVSEPAGAGSKACEKHEETIHFPEASRDNFLKALVWSDTNTILGSDGKLTFKRGDKSSNLFTSTKERQDCSDTIAVDSNNRTATLVARQGGDENSKENINGDDYDWYPFERPANHPDDWKWNAKKKCWESPPVTAQLAGTPEKGSADSAVTQNLGDTGSSAANQDSCETEGGALAWIMCPLTRMIDGALDWLDGVINDLLSVDHGAYTDENLHAAWGQVRNIAYIILVPIMLVMVIGTAVGYSGLDAYTVKRAMPRLLIAIVFIALSWSIVTFLIEFSNVIGHGVMGLLTAPFSDQLGHVGLKLSTFYHKSIWQAILIFPVSIGIIVAFWLFGGTLLLAAGVGLLVLLLRQLFIIALILAAPLAILTWIFPGNDKPWKLWWDLFSKLLMMYPLIIAVIAIGRIFAYLISQGAVLNSGFGGALQPLMIMLVWFLPYALIPLTFRFAGGLFATLTGMVNDRSKGLFDRQKQARANKLQRTAEGKMFKNAPRGGLRDRFNVAGASVMHANRAGLRPENWRTNLANARAATERAHMEKYMQEDRDYAMWKNNDTLNGFANKSNNEAELRELLTAYGGYTDQAQMEADIRRVEGTRRALGAEGFKQATFLQATAGGTFYGRKMKNSLTGEEKVFNWAEAMAQSAGNDDASRAYLAAQGKSLAMGAGRADEGAASFGTIFEATRAISSGATAEQAKLLKELDPSIDIRAGQKLTAAQASLLIHENVVESAGPGILAHSSMKPDVAENLAPIMVAKLDRAMAEGDERRVSQELASLAGTLDAISQSNPRAARAYADIVMNHGVVGYGGKDTVRELIEVYRNDDAFNQMRREYGRASEEDASRRRGPGGTEPPTAAPTAATGI